MTVIDAPKTSKRQQEEIPGITRPMTYEEYRNEGEVMARYDILNGYRVYYYNVEGQVASPTVEHQDIQLNIAGEFRAYQRRTASGRAVMAPCDVLITANPVHTRQPDVLYISQQRYGSHDPTKYAALSPAPELVVEILSPSDTATVLEAKLADYRKVDVQECWLVEIATQAVEVLQNTGGNWQRVAKYSAGQTVVSVTFPSLVVAVDTIFSR